MKSLGVLFKQRLGAPDIDRHGIEFGPQRFFVFIKIGLRHDQRILNHGAGTHGKQSVEPLVEGNAGQHRDQHCGRDRDDGKQRDDLHMQASPRPAPTPRLDDMPDLAPDNNEQQQHRDGIYPQQRNYHIRGRVDGQKAGQHHERNHCRQQRHDDGDHADQPGRKPRTCRYRVRRLDGGSVFDGRHRHPGNLRPAAKARLRTSGPNADETRIHI